MEKGVASDRAAAAQREEAASTATVARPPTGQESIADAGGGGRRRPGGAPSGSITHPAEEARDQATLSKDADGTWHLRNDETGESWSWEEDGGGLWRGEGGAPDVPGYVGGPEEIARRLSGTDSPPPMT